MLCVEDIKRAVMQAASEYNKRAQPNRQIARMDLFGSYAEGRENEASDVDLLVEFANPNVTLFTLAEVLDAMEEAVGMSVDLVQAPLPEDSILDIGKTVSLYAAA